MGNLYVIVCYTCMLACWVGPVMRVRVRPIILSGWGPLCELEQGPLYSMCGARNAS